ncbi:hypothetical protein FGO68_gene10674 [Halteria grandinella]|uniref:RING-type domain-containing protein n=1 Tax=Halteria grandinella TaxID=5974 RepID=A0A8J8SYV9_HALGN|nr:hypothetical protein FGO68_gene10674 [Halteria grandinella]
MMIDIELREVMSAKKISPPGLTKRKWKSLTQLVYKPPAITANDDNSLQCSICYLEFKEGCVLKELKCLHRFHNECLRPWFKQTDTCPLCRLKIK